MPTKNNRIGLPDRSIDLDLTPYYSTEVPFADNPYLGNKYGNTILSNNLEDSNWHHASYNTFGEGVPIGYDAFNNTDMRIFPRVDYGLPPSELPKGYTIPKVEDLPKLNKVDVPGVKTPKSNVDLKGMAPAIGTLVGGVGNKLISQGFSSGAGNAVAGVGSTVGGIVGTFNPVLGGIISAASGIVGGGLNRLTGSKMNKEGIAHINARIANNSAVANSLAKTSTTNDLIDKWSNLNTTTQINQSDVGKDGIWGNKAKKKKESLQRNLATTNAAASQGLYLGEKNVANTQQNLVDSNFKYAYGGPLDTMDSNMGAINYGFMSDYLAAKNKQAEIKNKITNTAFGDYGNIATNIFAQGGVIPNTVENEAVDMLDTPFTSFSSQKRQSASDYAKAGIYQDGQGNLFTITENGGMVPITRADADELVEKRKEASKKKQDTLINVSAGNQGIYALGGVLQSHGADWSNGLTMIGAGGTHEENPNEGVQVGVDSQGTPNLVEEGETIFNDYVFSKRIYADGGTLQRLHLPKKSKLTYADISKKLQKESLERPNDPISKAGLKKQLDILEEEQERQKTEIQDKRAQEAFAALSPEQKQAVMQQMAMAEQQQAMEQQNMQQQDIIPTEEQIAMEQQMQAPQEDMYQSNLSALGGKINRFDGGGDTEGFDSPKWRAVIDALYNGLGLATDEDWNNWVSNNNVTVGFDDPSELLDYLKEGFSLGRNPFEVDKNGRLTSLGEAIKKSNPILYHSLMSGNNFGFYTPTVSDELTFDFGNGQWGKGDWNDWNGSKDRAWQEAVEKGLVNEGMTNAQITDALKKTEAYQQGTKWLQDDEEHRRKYLASIIKSSDAPEKAKEHARKFVDKNGQWLENAKKGYDDIFGVVRNTYAGTYWKTPEEVFRGKETKNFLVDKDGNIQNFAISNIPTDKYRLKQTYNWQGKDNDMVHNYYELIEDKKKKDNAAVKTPEEEEINERYKPVLKNENLRYAALFGPALGLGLMAAGVGKPNTALLDGALSAISGGNALARTKPIGNYLTYRPMDTAIQQNVADASARATDRVITNAAGAGVAGNAMAGLLANEYNRQLGAGELARNALVYNDTLAKQVGEFNRGTDQFNADAFNKVSMANAELLNKNRQLNAQLALQAASQKMAADAAWNSSIYANLNGLAKGIGDLGRENAQHNMIARMAADGIFGNASKYTNVFDGYIEEEPTYRGAKGGKLNRKKRRGGLTY